MLKEIIDLGRVSNKLGSVFTFKDLPEIYVEVLIEKKESHYKIYNIALKHLSQDKDYSEYGSELYLKYGIHRGKKSSTIYIFPASFIFESKEKVQEQILNFLVTETKYKNIQNELKLDRKLTSKQIKSEIYPLIIKKILNDEVKIYPNITRYFKVILSNLDNIENKVEEAREEIKANLEDKIDKIKMKNLLKRVPIVVKIKKGGREYYFYEQKRCIFEIFKNIEFRNSASFIDNKVRIKSKPKCNVYTNLDAEVYPSGGFYYPFSTDKVNVKYNLKDDKNLFLLSKNAYIDFMVGRTFLETYNDFYFMGLNCYITATCLDDDILKEFQNDIKEAKSNLDGLIGLINKNIVNRFDILLNFYFWELAKTGGGKEIIEYIKDVIPSRIVQIAKLANNLKSFYKEQFNKEKFNYNWQQHIYNIYHKDNHKKYRTSLFRQIALGERIDIEQLLIVMNDNMQYSISKPEDNKDKYYDGTAIKHLMFLDWLNKIDKGVVKMRNDEKKQEFFKGKTYEEKLKYFLNNANLVKDSASMKVGVCVGLALNILSWSINGFDKKTLAFVGKRIERNNVSSVQAFVNEIFAKTQLHGFEHLQSVNIRFATQEMLSLDDDSFNKDEFVFGLFLGSELYSNVKSEKDPEPKQNQDEGDENGNS